MSSQFVGRKYEFKVEYSGGEDGKQKWAKFFLKDTYVRSLTMEGLIQHIKEKCIFLASTIKYLDSDKDWIDLSSEDSDSFVDMIESAEAVSERENLYRITLKVSNTLSPLAQIPS